jgi:hypothetical protein
MKAIAGGVAALAVGYTLIRYGAWHLGREKQKREGRNGRLQHRWAKLGGLTMHVMDAGANDGER